MSNKAPFGWDNPANRPKAYADLADLPEDERIKIIADRAFSSPGSRVEFVVDDHPKAERYLRKLYKYRPGVMQIDRRDHTAGFNAVLVAVVYRQPVAS